MFSALLRLVFAKGVAEFWWGPLKIEIKMKSAGPVDYYALQKEFFSSGVVLVGNVMPPLDVVLAFVLAPQSFFIVLFHAPSPFTALLFLECLHQVQLLPLHPKRCG